MSPSDDEIDHFDVSPAIEQTAAGLQYLLPGVEPLPPPPPAPERAVAARPTEARTQPWQLRRCVVRCTTSLYHQALALESRVGLPLSRIVTAVLLILPKKELDDLPDPGDPARHERVLIGNKQGLPRLAVRVPTGHENVDIRKCLGFVVDMAGGLHRIQQTRQVDSLNERLRTAEMRVHDLTEYVERVAFSPLSSGVRSREDALYVLGLPPDSLARPDDIATRFRAIAPVFHPDTGAVKSHVRMVQVIDARRLLLRALT